MALRLLLVVVLSACLSCGTPDDSAGRHECSGDVPGFTHRAADDAVPVHHVVGGSGPPVLLLHGFPETWWTWRRVMPLLARSHTVIVPDLRGVGCSPVQPAAFDADALAGDIDRLLVSMGVTPVAVVGHDLGGWVAYAYARRHRDTVTHLVLSGAVLPGFGLEDLLDFRAPGRGLPHLAFFGQPDVPELLIGGREREYFAAFIGEPGIEQSGALDVYAEAYARPGRLTAALGQYRALHTSAAQNRRDRVAPLPMPTLALSGTGQTGGTVDSLRRVAVDVRETALPGAGHYAQETRPDEFAAALLGFVGG